MNSLHWMWPLAGGLLIGLSAALYLLLNGRIAGISGLTANALGLSRGDSPKLGLGFIAGMLGGAALASALIRTPEIVLQAGWPLLLVGGLLVGFGTRLGSGCTSGHGVCGLARLSPRSIIATLVFMGTAALTVYLVRHVLGGVS